MSQVRMHSPPARTVKKPNQRWDRQRPITRGRASDHGLPPAPPTITGISPTSTTVGGIRAFTITGTNFPDGGLFYYTAPAQTETSAAGNLVSSTSITVTLPTSAVDTAGTITWHIIFGGGAGPDVPGTPNITVA